MDFINLGLLTIKVAIIQRFMCFVRFYLWYFYAIY